MSGLPGAIPPPGGRGPALRRSAADLDRLARVTPDDIEAARTMWEGRAPDGYQGLLDAKAEPKKGT